MSFNKYLDKIDIIYWINLNRSEKRRKNMETLLKTINIKNERIAAIDGKFDSDENIYGRYISENGFNKSRIEYSCLLSHLLTIKTFAESEYEYALILEDDLSLEYTKYWDKNISQIMREAPGDWEIIMLNYVSKHKLENNYTLNLNGRLSCCGSYLINKKGALRLINKIYKDNKFILLPNSVHTSDNYIYSQLRTYAYKYPYFTYPTENDSTIHDSHIFFHVYTKEIAFTSWNDKYKIRPSYGVLNIIFSNKLLQTIIFIIILTIFLLYIFKNKQRSNKIVISNDNFIELSKL
jgi:GR25 family glycosyltransferase involved in LPS biosynthesis